MDNTWASGMIEIWVDAVYRLPYIGWHGRIRFIGCRLDQRLAGTNLNL